MNESIATELTTRELSLQLREWREQPEMLRQLNERYALIYAERSRLLQEQLTPATFELAMKQMGSEARRGIPLKHWCFETAIDDAAKSIFFARSDQARKAGASQKTDPLQARIIQIVRQRPEITLRGLQKLLESKADEFSLEMDDATSVPEGEGPMIYFMNHDGKEKRVPLSGLKDRLSRAKKIVRSEIAQTG